MLYIISMLGCFNPLRCIKSPLDQVETLTQPFKLVVIIATPL